MLFLFQSGFTGKTCSSNGSATYAAQQPPSVVGGSLKGQAPARESPHMR